jgi:hypothetical protein
MPKSLYATVPPFGVKSWKFYFGLIDRKARDSTISMYRLVNRLYYHIGTGNCYDARGKSHFNLRNLIFFYIYLIILKITKGNFRQFANRSDQ